MVANSIMEEALRFQPQIVELRRRLHRYPELSYEEHKTSAILAEILADRGFSVRKNIARTGLVADIGTAGRTIALRAEMDALPLTENTGLSFASQNSGVMHACGHDAHMACAVAAASILVERQLPGKLRMIMQPAEEAADLQGITGAHRMVQEGVVEGVDAIIGLHVSTLLPAGKVAIPLGPVFASADDFRIRIAAGCQRERGKRSPEIVVIAAQIIQALQQIVSRRVSPLEPAVLTVGSIHTDNSCAGTATELSMAGTVRTFNQQVREHIWKEMESTCDIATIYGAQAELVREAGYPATINDESVARVMHGAAVDLIGADNVLAINPRMAAEDFAFFAQVKPAAFMLLGVELPGDRRNHHRNDFDLEESKLYVGTAIMAETVLRLMTA